MRSRILRRGSMWGALCALALAFGVLSVRAQETRGKLAGRVVDPSGGAVAGASVTITDPARGNAESATTNRDGLFLASYLLPGTYEVTVEVAGFQKSVTNNVLIQINETRSLDITLKVGGIEDTVVVSAERLTVNNADANMGLTIDQKRLAELPLIHGDPYKIMGLATGLTHSGSQRLDRPYEPTHIVGYAMDGTRGNRSDLLIDGVSSTATANANEVIATYVPPSDLVQEFRVQTATFDSQFGNTEGGVTSIVIKSGTNRLHGTLYVFAEPVDLAANDVFGKARGQARVDSSHTRPGLTLTGPVRIPGLYNGTDKTFFSVGYEHIKDVRPRFDAGTDTWVPTAALRNGDFSAYSSNITIYDPLTRVPTGNGQFTAQPFPGNVIPANRISPVARAVLDYYSLPKNAGLSGNIFDSTLPETAQYDNVTARIDQRVSDANQMFIRGSWYKRDSRYNDYMGTAASGVNFQFVSYQAMIDDVHTFNGTTLLNVRYGVNRFERNQDAFPERVKSFDLTRLGFPEAYNGLVPEENRSFPRFDFTGGPLGNGQGADFRPVTTHNAAATLNKVLTRHSLKVGGELRIYREDSRSTGNNRSGQYAFNNTYTRQNSASGTDYLGLQGFASFLLGLPSTTSITRASDYSEYSKTYGFFVQDDWRVSSNLTVNLGVRYELEAPLVERNNKSVSGFDFDYVQPIEATVRARYAALNDPALKALQPQLNIRGGLRFAGVDGGSELYRTPKNTILPRFGFNYQLSPRMVVRGGVGLFAGFLGERRGDVITTGFGQTTTIGTTTNAAGAPIPYDIRTALLTTPILEPIGSAQGRQTSLGNNISFFNQDPKVSKQLRWQIGFQRELPANVIVDAAYVGNYGYDIEITRNINALPNQYLNADNARTAAMNANNTFLTASVANPFAGLLPGTGFNNATIARSQLLRPYPAFGDINTTNNEGKSWYHSGQFGLQKRFSKGNTLGLAYTYSRWMQATEYLNPADERPTKMISDLDSTHRLAVSAIVELPFGKGRRFLSGAGGLANLILGGWQFQGVYTYQTGFPIAFGTVNATSQIWSNDAFYDGGQIALSSGTTSKWINTDPFRSILNDNATNATPVNHLRSLPIRFDDVRRDAINNVDVSVLKKVSLGGDVQLELKADFINALNEPYFPAPNTSATSATFGQISASNQDNYARRGQVSVKLVF